MSTQQTAITQFVNQTIGTSAQFAFRRLGATWGVPLLLLTFFRGTMDLWDPLVVNGLAAHRPVILMDYAGSGFSTGRTAPSVADSADDVIKFLHAIGEPEVDILGHSIGGFIAPMVALNAPDTLKVRKVIIVASGPSAGADTLLNPHQDEVNKLVGGPDVTFANFSALFFPLTPQGTAAVTSWWARIHERNVSTSGEVRSNVLSYNYADGGAGLLNQTKLFGGFLSANQTLGRNGSYARLAQLKTPVLITNGNFDYLIPTKNSFTLQQMLPNAELILYPKSGHGHLFQYADLWTRHVLKFIQS